jgi:peptidoglycan/LPS O-acetylase OafA/YrhL
VANSERVEVIDALRGAAALAVVLYHYVGFIPLRGIPVSNTGSVIVTLTRYGHLGVPVFFVLSGYVIAMTAARYPFTSVTGCRFVLRRLVRLAPPYWAMVVLIAVTLIAGRSAGYFRTVTITPVQIAVHLAYAQELLRFPPLDVAYWTLCLEVQFYLTFAVFAVVVHKYSPGVQAGWFVALTVGSVLVDLFGVLPPAWFPRLWHQFGIGVVTWYAGRQRSAQVALVVLLVALVVLGVYRSHAADITVSLVAALLLCPGRWFVHAPARLGVMLGLGRISYSLYLVHGFIGILLSAWFRSSANRSEMASWIAIATVTVGAVAFATAFYYLCETRAVEWSRHVRVAGARASAMGQTALAVNTREAA